MNARLPKAAELAELPLTDDAAILERVAVVVQVAARHQLWFLLLDDARRQLPVVIPMDVPRRPDGDAGSSFAGMFAGLMGLDDVAHVVCVYERPGPATPSRDDLAWLAALAEAVELSGASVLGLFFATNRGVRCWPLHHDARQGDAMMQEWPYEDDDHPDTGGAGARGAGHA